MLCPRITSTNNGRSKILHTIRSRIYVLFQLVWLQYLSNVRNVLVCSVVISLAQWFVTLFLSRLPLFCPLFQDPLTLNRLSKQVHFFDKYNDKTFHAVRRVRAHAPLEIH